MRTSLSAWERSPCSMAVLKPAFTQSWCTNRTVFTLLQKTRILGLDRSCSVCACAASFWSHANQQSVRSDASMCKSKCPLHCQYAEQEGSTTANDFSCRDSQEVPDLDLLQVPLQLLGLLVLCTDLDHLHNSVPLSESSQLLLPEIQRRKVEGAHQVPLSVRQ